MNKQFLLDGLGWGVLLWLIGYILGIVLFAVVPASMLGWVIMPIGMAITLWVLLKKMRSKSLPYHFKTGIVWTLIAVIFDYLFLVKLFKPADGYYKLDVYLYYLLTFAMPVAVGWCKSMQKK